jgi:hypothetical protein
MQWLTRARRQGSGIAQIERFEYVQLGLPPDERVGPCYQQHPVLEHTESVGTARATRSFKDERIAAHFGL